MICGGTLFLAQCAYLAGAGERVWHKVCNECRLEESTRELPRGFVPGKTVPDELVRA